ncbi:ABC transporter substrate-binding protein [Motiliproteus sp. MSK22-1]|uniref:ABC transporter substrate-binding protein n=1 Tax=Motiliproteus sp. MSK22-1 TaxID=1897630 RepID=UPI0013011F4D|nr:ABC transporter substrate-binding protein [Motiliproteus sp. MSK22-1]
MIEKVSLQLLWKNQFQFAGYYVAKEKGYYAEEGLEVEIREMPSELDLVKSVLSEDSTFAIGRSSILIDKAKGARIVALMAAFQQSPLMLITKQSDQIREAKDLFGQRVMITPDAKNVAEVLAMLLKSGISADDYIRQPHSFNLTDLIEDKTDAYAGYLSNEPFQLEKLGIPYRIIHPRDYGFDMYSDILFTSEEYVQKNPVKTMIFVEASRRGWEYAFAHIEETARMIHENYNSQSRSVDALVYEGKALKELAYAEGVEFGDISLDRFQEMAQIYRVTGVLDRDYDIDNLVYQPLEHAPELGLSREEKRFLQRNRRFHLCVNPDWMPYEGVVEGKHQGVVAGYMDLLSKKLGVTFSFGSFENWAQSLATAQRGGCDLVAGAMQTPGRSKNLLFTNPYFSMPVAVAVRESNSDSVVEGPLAILKGSAFEEILRGRYSETKLVPVVTAEEGLNLVEEGAAKGFVSAAGHINAELQISQRSGFLITSPINDNWDFSLAVYKNPRLVDILNHAINSISASEHQAIRSRWLPVQYDHRFDYQLFWKISAGVMLLLLFLAYRYKVISDYNRKLEILANSDQLTGIDNRYALVSKLEDQIKIASRYHRSLSLIFFDIDDFKQVNDQYGHNVGDHILQELARVISANLRDADFFGRWGGEEFLILLPELDLNSAEAGAEKLREVVSSAHFSHQQPLSCSFGVVEYRPEEKAQTFVARADKMLYRAKGAGKNCVCSS